MSLARVTVLLLAVAVVATLVAAPTAGGHETQLTRMVPAADSTVDGASRRVVLEFNTPPALEGDATVTAPDGTDRQVAATVDGTRVSLPFRPDMDGRWAIAVRARSSDGHVIRYERFLVVAGVEPATDRTTGGYVSELEALFARLVAALRALAAAI